MAPKGSKYGPAHQKMRARLIARWRPGQPCARCGQPTWDATKLHLGHRDGAGPRAYLGLEHDRCNESAGGVVGTSRQGKRTRQRVCPICHVTYRATRASQLACSREHADAVKRGDQPQPVSGRSW